MGVSRLAEACQVDDCEKLHHNATSSLVSWSATAAVIAKAVESNLAQGSRRKGLRHLDFQQRRRGNDKSRDVRCCVIALLVLGDISIYNLANNRNPENQWLRLSQNRYVTRTGSHSWNKVPNRPR